MPGCPLMRESLGRPSLPKVALISGPQEALPLVCYTETLSELSSERHACAEHRCENVGEDHPPKITCHNAFMDWKLVNNVA